ncbi:MAG TPA: hypothetical protein VL382_01365 [Terriglobales bacterium]|nr:hypothetical protein [Terriglobales bacterium]
MHSNVRPFPAPAAPAAAPGATDEVTPPVWFVRTEAAVTVVFCIWIGLALIVVPWVPPLWNENSLLAAWPNLRAFLGLDFVRGVVSGLGLLDIWLGVSEAVHYRDPKR